MRVICYPSKIEGEISAIPSKSDSHRILICSALAKEETLVLMDTELSEDIEATVRCLCSLGADISKEDKGLLVKPIKACPSNPVLDCGESGSTLRFLLPVAAALGCKAKFIGSGRLPQRPIEPLLKSLALGGIAFDNDRLPLQISGKLSSANFSLPGDISSQFISGLLMALPLVSGGGTISLTKKAESTGYIDMTIKTLSHFSVNIKEEENRYIVKESVFSTPKQIRVEGDWSNSAFFLAGGALAGEVLYSGLSKDTKQGDSEITSLLSRFGAEVSQAEGKFNVKASKLKGIEIDAKEIPDLVPILAAVAAFSDGKTEIFNAKRLRLKESDRLKTVANMLSSLGADVEEKQEGLTIYGKSTFAGGQVDCSGDHRIAMSAAIAALLCKSETVLEGAEAINKSYPNFFEDYKALGGKCHVINDG